MLGDFTLQPLGVNIVAPDPEEGSADTLQLAIIVGMALPFQQGPGQPPIMAPVAQVRFPIDRDFGLKLADKLKEECEKLKKPSDIAIAGSLQGVEGLAQADRQLRSME